MTYMTYNDFKNAIDQVKADNAEYYGDFGFDFIVEWGENDVQNIFVTWPRLDSTYVEDAFRFGEALQAFCFDLNKLIGTVVEEN